MESHVDYKFEQFLRKKFLDHEEFEQIFYYGIGIMVKGGNKKYGRVVVTNKAIYWVNDPPKTVNKEMELKDVLSVELKDNFPDFLEGEFRRKCQHFEINFLKLKTTELQNIQQSELETSLKKETPVTPGKDKVEVTKVGCCGRGKKPRPGTQITGEPPEEPPPLESTTENGDDGSVEESMNEDKTDYTTGPVVDLDYKMNETLVLTARSNYIVEHNLEECSIDIYILNGDLKLLPCVKHASNLALEQLTLKLNYDYEMLHCPLVIMEDDTLNYHYRQLKEDLIASRYNPLLVFKYTNELCNAATRYFHIKKLFWANDEMCDYYIKQLERIYPECRLDLSIRKHIVQRVDELELALLILELFACMMEGTHMFSKRAEVLRSNKSERVYKLIFLMTTQPDLPHFDQHVRTAILKHAANETKVLLSEITSIGGNIVYNLLLDGSFTPPIEAEDFTEASIVSYFENNLETTKEFFQSYISQVIGLLKPPEDRNIHRELEEPLQPQEVVQIYRAFSIMQSLIRYSLKLREFFVEEFTVDFKFRMQKHQIMQKIPSHYPITFNTLKLVARVTPIIAKETQIVL